MRTFAFFTSIFFCCLFTIGAASAQELIRGRVIDSDTREPIPFANIGVTKLSIGTVSDEKGNYQLRTHSPADLVTFSSIGYQTEYITAEKLASGGDVSLQPRPYQAPTVELSAKSLTKEVILGAKLEEQGHSVSFGSSELGTEIGALIRISKETFIKSAHFQANHAAGDNMLFRVNLYKCEDGQLGENLLPENVIISGQQKREVIDVDLSEFNLITASDVLLSLEWIKDDEGAGNVGLTFRSKKSRRDENTYSKHTSQAPFIMLSSLAPQAPKLQLGFFLVGKQAP
ncbi:MAG: carboxypeptidase-like regulatory domain-containing protein [Phaeodactylibacter sp.]|nr:carboxypeptidase-like regulatory domain-containing protein [Phaeodactylibacter sp.]MCB9265084.1 carboxypeptidase-like regulatory domain-containing protein [Lewinellaceae bacterium]MCB9287381.1 carboxypeptidase-like regulatory domain-containing protein [Lewinellaceae bacterium]